MQQVACKKCGMVMGKNNIVRHTNGPRCVKNVAIKNGDVVVRVPKKKVGRPSTKTTTSKEQERTLMLGTLVHNMCPPSNVEDLELWAEFAVWCGTTHRLLKVRY